MRKQSISEGLILACACMLVFLPAKFSYLLLFNGEFTFRLLWSTVTLAYLILSGTIIRRRAGALVVGTLCITGLLGGAFMLHGFQICLLCTLMIWSLRSVYRYSSFISSGLDLALSAVALSFAMWAYQTTGSLGLMIWCYFLAQSVSALIPQRISTAGIAGSMNAGSAKTDRFENAYGNAERALRQIITHAS